MDLLCLIDPSKKEFNDTVDRVLDKPEYARLKMDLTKYTERIIKWLAEKLSNIFESLFGNVSLNSNVSTAIVIIFLLALLGLIVVLIVKLAKGIERRKKLKEILGVKIDDDTTPESLKEKAAAYIEAGDLRHAVRYDYIALLFLMHKSNIVYLEDTKTNEEIYKYLEKKKFSKLQNLSTCINIFNFVWYGHKEISNEMYEEWTKNLSTIWNEVKDYAAENK